MSTMNRTTWVGVASFAALAVCAAGACSSSKPTYPAANVASDAAAGSETAGEGGADVTLTVKNFLSWCSVTINGGAASTEASVTASLSSGSTATVVVMPASSSFMIGPDPWFGVAQNGGAAAPGTDNGTGTSETSTATVVVTGNQCVSVCCQEPNNAPTPCPTTDPCP